MICFIILCLLAAAWAYCGIYFPFWKNKTPVLPVLRFGKIGCAPAGSACKKEWLSRLEFKKRLDWILKLGFTPITPEDLLAARQGVALPPRPVVLIFEYGLSSFYTEVFPLLQERGLKACVTLCSEHIGQYNAWQNPQQEPWQNTLNEEQLTNLKKSKLISFASHGLSYTNLNPLAPAEAVRQAQESKARLEKLYKLNIHTFVYPQTLPSDALDQAVRAAGFEITVSRQNGNNPLRAELAFPLKTIPTAAGLWRLRAQMTHL